MKLNNILSCSGFVSLITLLLFFVAANQTFAQNNLKILSFDENVSILLNNLDRDHTEKLSKLFNNKGRDLNTNSIKFSNNLSKYLIRISIQIQKDTVLLNQLNEYLALQDYPDGDFIFNVYTKKLFILRSDIDELKVDILPFIKNDAYIIEAVSIRYGLYNPFTRFFKKKRLQSKQNALEVIKNRTINLQTELLDLVSLFEIRQ